MPLPDQDIGHLPGHPYLECLGGGKARQILMEWCVRTPGHPTVMQSKIVVSVRKHTLFSCPLILLVKKSKKDSGLEIGHRQDIPRTPGHLSGGAYGR